MLIHCDVEIVCHTVFTISCTCMYCDTIRQNDMSSIVSGVETLDTFTNSDVVNVCTRLLNEATVTRMNLTEAVRHFLWNLRMLSGQTERFIEAHPELSDKDRDNCITEAAYALKEMRESLVQYSMESFSDETPSVQGGSE